MLSNLLNQLHKMNAWSLIPISLLITGILTGILYVFLFYILRSIFRQFEKDFPLVTLNISAPPAIIIFAITSLKISFAQLLTTNDILSGIQRILTASLIIAFSYWFIGLFIQVFIYYIKDYTKQSEVMWDDVLLPIIEAVVPIIVYIFGAGLVLKSFGVDLTGIWVALGGATFVLGFALQDILANFFSGIVLLIDTPFRFGDILLLEDGSIGMLRKIGLRVTHLYIFSSHCDIYIPNSVLQGQKITNLSRPTSFYHHSISLEIPSECNLDDSKKLIEEIVLAHPDTLGDISNKLELMPEYYNSEECDPLLIEQQEIGKARVIAEQALNLKLELIEQSLEALVVTMKFSEKGGLTLDEIQNVQQEYQEVLELIGFRIIEQIENKRTIFNFQETNDEDGLIELIRQWYRNWLQDPNLLDEDQFFISDEWERKINLLKRRSLRLSQKISNPQADESRLDDYVVDFIQWLREKLKVPRKKWQEPKINILGINNNEESSYYISLEISFFVDDIKLENGKRGERVKSQIYQEIFRHFKNTYLDFHDMEEDELPPDIYSEKGRIKLDISGK